MTKLHIYTIKSCFKLIIKSYTAHITYYIIIKKHLPDIKYRNNNYLFRFLTNLSKHLVECFIHVVNKKRIPISIRSSYIEMKAGLDILFSFEITLFILLFIYLLLRITIFIISESVFKKLGIFLGERIQPISAITFRLWD